VPRFPPAQRPARLEELADACVRRQDAKSEALASGDWTTHGALNGDVAVLVEGLGALTPQERVDLLARIEALRASREC
jgi:hypothetical protein